MANAHCKVDRAVDLAAVHIENIRKTRNSYLCHLLITIISQMPLLSCSFCRGHDPLCFNGQFFAKNKDALSTILTCQSFSLSWKCMRDIFILSFKLILVPILIFFSLGYGPESLILFISFLLHLLCEYNTWPGPRQSCTTAALRQQFIIS